MLSSIRSQSSDALKSWHNAISQTHLSSIPLTPNRSLHPATPPCASASRRSRKHADFVHPKRYSNDFQRIWSFSRFKREKTCDAREGSRGRKIERGSCKERLRTYVNSIMLTSALGLWTVTALAHFGPICCDGITVARLIAAGEDNANLLFVPSQNSQSLRPS